MRPLALLAGVALGALACQAQAAPDMEAGKRRAAVCRTCHGLDGCGTFPHYPNIARQSAAYLETQLKAFREGTRQNENMAVIARMLSDADIANLAAYYAQLEFTCEAR